MESKKTISVIVPMYFEEQVVNECYQRLTKVLNSEKKYNYEVIFVNDGSKDDTLKMLEKIANKDDKVKIISFSRNFGHQAAVSAGLKHVSGDVVVIIDADMQDPPELIWDMVSLWEKGNQVVYAKRKQRQGESIFKLLSAKAFYKILNRFSDVYIPKDTGDFRLVDKAVVNVINSMPEQNKFLRGLFAWIGFNQIAYEYERKERIAGKSKYSVKKMISLAENGIIGFSYKPLKIILGFANTSIILSFLSLLSIITLIYLDKKGIIIYLFVLQVASLFTSILLYSIYIVSMYISRIYDEVKKRPEYIINKKQNFRI